MQTISAPVSARYNHETCVKQFTVPQDIPAGSIAQVRFEGGSFVLEFVLEGDKPTLVN